jgi:hypothetical protein
MLLQTFTSQPFLYRLPASISSGTPLYHPELTTPPRIYGEEYDGGGVTVIFLNEEQLVGGYDVIYLWLTKNMVFFPGYNYSLYRFNATTGEYLGLIDTDATLFVFAKFAQGLDGTVYRCDDTLKIFKCQVSAAGVTSDGVVIYDLSTFTGVTSIDAFNIDTVNDIALICANVANQLRVHNLSTGALLRTVALPASAVQVMPASNGKCYVMSSNHIMTLIDYLAGTVASSFQVQDTFDASIPGVTVAWDAKYNRFLSWVYAPVDTTGQNTSVIKGYFPVPQPTALVAPIPLKPPRHYSTTPLLVRLCGDLGEPVGGVVISLISSDTSLAAVVGFPAITDGDGEAVGNILDLGEGAVTITATTAIVGPPAGPALVPVWPDPLPAGEVGLLYSFSLNGYGGTPGYTWADPALPAGLTLDTGSGLIHGTPTTPVTAMATTPTITDSASPPVTMSKLTHITINPGSGPGPLTALWPDPIPDGDVGVPYSYFLTASGGLGLGFTYSLTSGTLPVGITLNTATGEVSSGGVPLTTAISFDAVTFGVTG